MTDIHSELKNLTCPIVLYGTGDGADRLLDDLERLGVKADGVFASDGFVRKRKFRGFEVESFDALFSRFPDMTVLMCFGSDRTQVRENMKRISSKVPLLFPEYPVYGDTVFDGAFANKHCKELQFVRSRLADGDSVKTFDGIVNFRLCGEPKYLFDCETEAEPTFELPKDVVFADFGAYNGDTVLDFVQKNNSYSKIYAVEPDAKNFEKLRKNTSEIKNIEYVNAAVGDKCGQIFATAKKGRGTHVSSDGTKPTACITADSLFEGENRPIFIKADVEGNEGAFIRGASEVIRKKRPLMRIACYHRSEDLFAIPTAVLSLRDDYRLFIRHFPAIPSWNTEYFFI